LPAGRNNKYAVASWQFLMLLSYFDIENAIGFPPIKLLLDAVELTKTSSSRYQGCNYAVRGPC
jgi:hypothetical protein